MDIADSANVTTSSKEQELLHPGEVTWSPPGHAVPKMQQFMDRVNTWHGLKLNSYRDLHLWSVSDVSMFWEDIVRFFAVLGDGMDGPAIEELRMPGAVWYPNAKLNFAENVLRFAKNDSTAHQTAILHVRENNTTDRLTWVELKDRVESLAANFRARGIGANDVIAAVLPNVPEAIIGLLAAASIGAVWAINSPDMSVDATLERISQLDPKAVIGIDSYRFKGKEIILDAYFAEIAEAFEADVLKLMVRGSDPSVERLAGFLDFTELMHGDARLKPQRMPFAHPLWVLFSSGTTGAPKGIVHSHGGITLEAFKGIGIQQDMGPSDRYYVAANTSWMVWNTLTMTLMVGSSVVTYAGSPRLGGDDRQFEILSMTETTMFATGAAYLALGEKSELVPREKFDLGCLRRIMSTASPLSPSTWRWVHEAVKTDVHLGSDSGGTDICSGMLGSNPLSPVYLGELQGPCLGVAAEVWDEEGNRVYNEVGELVVTAPMPSMPVAFWNDPHGHRMYEAYFDHYPATWRHGDWVTETARGSFIVQGRSDATLNRQGVRLGTADIYAVLDDISQVAQSLVVGVEFDHGEYYMPLFVELTDGQELSDGLTSYINAQIRTKTSARHVPDEIVYVPEVPVSHTNKRLEVPIKRLYLGMELQKALNIGSVANPEALNWFVEHAGRIRKRFQRA